MTVKAGDYLEEGQVYATCPETPAIVHKIMLAPGLSGEVTFAAQNGKYKLNDHIVTIKDKIGNEKKLTLCQFWPIPPAPPHKGAAYGG